MVIRGNIGLDEDQKLRWIEVLAELKAMNLKCMKSLGNIRSILEITAPVVIGSQSSVKKDILHQISYNQKLYSGFVESTKWTDRNAVKMALENISMEYGLLLNNISGFNNTSDISAFKTFKSKVLVECDKISSLSKALSTAIDSIDRMNQNVKRR